MTLESIVPFTVDDVRFELDISGLRPRENSQYKLMADQGRVYEPVMTRCLTKLLKGMPRPRFLDVGGHAGYYTCYVAALLGPESDVCAVESYAPYCEGIRRSCLHNGRPNVRVFEVALSNRTEVVHVHAACFSVVSDSRQPDGTTMTVTLDELCEREGLAPNIVKMDVHGSEGKVLFGMRSLLPTLDYLLLELHAHHRLEMFSPGIARSDIMNLFWDSGLSVYHIAGHFGVQEQNNSESNRAGRFASNRASIRAGRFAYHRVTPDNAKYLFFGRLWEEFLLVTPRQDLSDVLGESVNDPLLTY